MLPLALENEALCQGAILYAAAQISNMAGELTPNKVNLAMYNKALRLLYESLRKEPQRFKDVFVIAAIAVAGFDLTYGRKDELRRHLDSMHKIVSSIGGLPYLGLGGLAAHLVLWIDFFGSILLDRAPLYTLPTRPEINLPGPPQKYGSAFAEMLEKAEAEAESETHQTELQLLQYRTSNSGVATTTIDKTTPKQNYVRLLKASIQTCRLTELLEYITSSSTSSSISTSTTSSPSRETEYFSYKRNLTDQILSLCNSFYHSHSHLYSNKTNKVNSQTFHLQHAITLTSTTLDLYILHNVGPTHQIFSHLSLSLQRTLLRLDLSSIFSPQHQNPNQDQHQHQHQHQYDNRESDRVRPRISRETEPETKRPREILLWILLTTTPVFLPRDRHSWFVSLLTKCLRLYFDCNNHKDNNNDNNNPKLCDVHQSQSQNPNQRTRTRNNHSEKGKRRITNPLLLPRNWRSLLREKILKKYIWSEMFLEMGCGGGFMGVCDEVVREMEMEMEMERDREKREGGGGGGHGDGEGWEEVK